MDVTAAEATLANYTWSCTWEEVSNGKQEVRKHIVSLSMSCVNIFVIVSLVLFTCETEVVGLLLIAAGNVGFSWSP
jgi:hypothetical protein